MSISGLAPGVTYEAIVQSANVALTTNSIPASFTTVETGMPASGFLYHFANKFL